MRPGELFRFNFNDPKNVYLSFDRNPWLVVRAVAALLVCFLILSAAALCQHCAAPIAHTRGAALMGLFLLLPILIRVIVLAVTFGLIGEYFFRRTYCAYENMPAYAIGPSGIASLDPWSPRAFAWNEICEVRRDWTPGSLLTNRQPIMLVFTATSVPPAGIPGWLWNLIPSWLTGRQIVNRRKGWAYQKLRSCDRLSALPDRSKCATTT